MKPIDTLLKFPFLVFVFSFAALWLSTRIGASFRTRPWKLRDDEREDFGVIQAASLTLLGLIIGFSFSMAIGRYDQRKNYEEEEANAIGTEYFRADLLPAADAGRVRAQLRSYLKQRILFYETRNARELQQIDKSTAQLQAELWAACLASATAQPTALTALAISGMNDVLNSQGYTLAAWRNRIPTAAWILLEAIAICCSLLIGYGARHAEVKGIVFLILPILVSLSFCLIADIDSPRGGVIRVRPQNLATLSQSLQAH